MVFLFVKKLRGNQVAGFFNFMDNFFSEKINKVVSIRLKLELELNQMWKLYELRQKLRKDKTNIKDTAKEIKILESRLK